MINVVQSVHNDDLQDLVANGTVSHDNAYGTYKIKKHDEWIKQGKAKELAPDDLVGQSIESWKVECDLPSHTKIHIAEYDQIQQWCKDGILERGWPKLEKNHEEWEAKRKDLYQQHKDAVEKRDSITTGHWVSVPGVGDDWIEDPVAIEKQKPLIEEAKRIATLLVNHNLYGKKY